MESRWQEKAQLCKVDKEIFSTIHNLDLKLSKASKETLIERVAPENYTPSSGLVEDYDIKASVDGPRLAALRLLAEKYPEELDKADGILLAQSVLLNEHNPHKDDLILGSKRKIKPRIEAALRLSILSFYLKQRTFEPTFRNVDLMNKVIRPFAKEMMDLDCNKRCDQIEQECLSFGPNNTVPLNEPTKDLVAEILRKEDMKEIERMQKTDPLYLYRQRKQND